MHNLEQDELIIRMLDTKRVTSPCAVGENSGFEDSHKPSRQRRAGRATKAGARSKDLLSSRCKGPPKNQNLPKGIYHLIPYASPCYLAITSAVCTAYGSVEHVSDLTEHVSRVQAFRRYQKQSQVRPAACQMPCRNGHGCDFGAPHEGRGVLAEVSFHFANHRLPLSNTARPRVVWLQGCGYAGYLAPYNSSSS
jgi:hypothetical protein